MGPEGVRIEVVDLDAGRAGGAGDGDALDAHERARAAALREAPSRGRYVAAHSALRRMLGDATGVAPGAVVILRAPCVACGAPHGKPYVEGGPSFSLSRSGRWAAVAVAESAGLTVGIDLEERQDPVRLAPLRETVLGPGEAGGDLLRTWVRKEALLKATGEGLTRDMTTLRADDERVHDLALAEGLVGAVALFTDASRRSTKVRRR